MIGKFKIRINSSYDAEEYVMGYSDEEFWLIAGKHIEIPFGELLNVEGISLKRFTFGVQTGGVESYNTIALYSDELSNYDDITIIVKNENETETLFEHKFIPNKVNYQEKISGGYPDEGQIITVTIISGTITKLPETGPISLAMVNQVLWKSSNSLISLNDSDVRSLSDVSSGTISMADLRGKSAGQYFGMCQGGYYDTRFVFKDPETGIDIQSSISGSGGGLSSAYIFGKYNILGNTILCKTANFVSTKTVYNIDISSYNQDSLNDLSDNDKIDITSQCNLRYEDNYWKIDVPNNLKYNGIIFSTRHYMP